MSEYREGDEVAVTLIGTIDEDGWWWDTGANVALYLDEGAVVDHYLVASEPKPGEFFRDAMGWIYFRETADKDLGLRNGTGQSLAKCFPEVDPYGWEVDYPVTVISPLEALK